MNIDLIAYGEWVAKHRSIMEQFLMYINKVSDKFVLKGGTSLLFCYGLDRFSEDLYFDGYGDDFFRIVDNFVDVMSKNGYSITYRKDEDTQTVKRVFLHYSTNESNGYSKPLKIEVSYRKKVLLPDEVAVVNGIRVYTIESLFIMKLNVFNYRNKIRDLYDIVFIYKNYKKYLSPTLVYQLIDTIAFQGAEQFDFLIKDQEDTLIDKDKLLEDFLTMYYELGLA